MKKTTKYMIVSDNKHYCSRVFDTKHEAQEYGNTYMQCGYFSNFYAFPVNKVWLRVR